MHLALKTLLNRVEPMKGFVYESSRISAAAGTRKGSMTTCGGFGSDGPVHAASRDGRAAFETRAVCVGRWLDAGLGNVAAKLRVNGGNVYAHDLGR